MLPGPDQIIACPHCGTRARYTTLMSGNTLGARLWTDGRQVLPMFPRLPAVVQCSGCDEAYWLNDAEELDTVNNWAPDASASEYASTSAVTEPTAVQYHEAIARGLGDTPERERFLRTLTMWQENDAVRDAVDPGARQLSAAAIDNLTALLELLADSEGVDSRVIRAEVLRELGRFDEAKAVLLLVTDDEYSWVVDTLRDLCDQRVSVVREMIAPV